MRTTLLRSATLLAACVACLAFSGCPSETAPFISSAAMTPVTITALDSIDGTYLGSGFSITAKNSAGTTSQFTAGSNPCTILVNSNDTYSFAVTSSGRAQDCHENIAVGTSPVSGTYFCEALGQSNFAVESPSIKSISYTKDADPTSAGAVYTEISEGSSIALPSLTAFKVITLSKASVVNTSWSGFAGIGLDHASTSYQHLSYSARSESYDSTTGYFTTTLLFLPTLSSVTFGSHSLDVVAYDRTNNRVERTISIVNPTPYTGGADIGGASFSDLKAEFGIYGTSNAVFSASPKGLKYSGSGSYEVLVGFKLLNGTTNVPIIGVKLYRSSNGGSSWSLAAAANYGTVSTGDNGTHYLYDMDSSLSLGVSYMYKVIAFTDDVHTKESAPTPAAAFLPVFTSSLVSPVNRETSFDTSSGSFVYSISDPSLWNSSLSGSYHFAFCIKNSTGFVYYGQFCYDLGTQTLYYYNSANNNFESITALGLTSAACIDFDSANGRITLKHALLNNAKTNALDSKAPVFSSGVTYYWDIFGEMIRQGTIGSSATMTSQYFEKDLADTANGTSAVSKSSADTYANGQDTLNGWFIFTAQ